MKTYCSASPSFKYTISFWEKVPDPLYHFWSEVQEKLSKLIHSQCYMFLDYLKESNTIFYVTHIPLKNVSSAKISFFFFLRMAASKPTSSGAVERSALLGNLKGNCEKLRKFITTVEDYIDCSSYMCSNFEIGQINHEMKSFMNHCGKMQQTFDEVNENLYQIADDSDVFPVAEQDPNGPFETEKFREKKELSKRVVHKAITYIENPIYTAWALQITKNKESNAKMGRFLKSQWGHISKMLSKFFPEEVDIIPSPGSGLTCPDYHVFENLQMPLIRLYTKLVDKVECKRLCNEVVQDSIFTMFKKINTKFESFFQLTIWQNPDWMNKWGDPEAPATYPENESLI